LLIGGVLYFSIFNSLKLLLFYAPSTNNDFRGLLIFDPFIIMLFISSLFAIAQEILHKNTSYNNSKHKGLTSAFLLIFIFLLVLGLPLIKQFNVKLGVHEGINPDGSKQNVIISSDKEKNEWTYIIKRENNSNEPLFILAIYGNKTKLNQENISVENGYFVDGKLTVDPQKEVIVTVHSSEPFYTMTFDIENSLSDSYIFTK